MKKNLHFSWHAPLYLALLGLSILGGFLVAQQNSPKVSARDDRNSQSLQSATTATPQKVLNNKFLSPTAESLATSSVSDIQAQPASIVSHLPKPEPLKAIAKTTPTQIFYANRQCDRLTTAIEQIPSSGSEQETATRTLRSLLERQKIYGVKVNNYQVTLENGVATVDITLDPRSQRRMTSLSSCEQFALFSSIKTTLLQNQALTVNEVKFTEAGREIYL
jgi:hypothetical protein